MVFLIEERTVSERLPFLALSGNGRALKGKIETAGAS
jgi:hypothetical protein